MAEKRPTRRLFLQGGIEPGAATAAQAEPAPLDFPLGGGAGSPYVVKVERKAMACQFAVMLPAIEGQLATETALAALDEVDALETQMTIYRPTSEILEINRRAHEEPVPVEPRLFELLQTCQELYRATEGAFDITSGPLSTVWGFSRREGRVPQTDELRAARERVGGDAIVLNAEDRTITFTRGDVEINVNAIGKGYALDRCEELFAEAGVMNYLIHGGNSSVLTRGLRSPNQQREEAGEKAAPAEAEQVPATEEEVLEKEPPANSQRWTLGLRHPQRPQRRILELWLDNRALGTSGTATQHFTYRGRRFGHILDPRSGWPAEGILSATALAPSAALADAHSTAFYVMGLEKTRAYCAERPELAAILVTPGEREGAIEIHAFGLEDDAWWLEGESPVG